MFVTGGFSFASIYHDTTTCVPKLKFLFSFFLFCIVIITQYSINAMSEGSSKIVTLCVCCLALPFCAGVIAYVVFTILFLIRDYSVCGDRSPLWVYVMSAILVGLMVNNRPKRKDEEENNGTVAKLLYGLISPCFNFIYGSIVIFGGHVCHNMKQTGLWVIANIIYWSSLVVMAILLLFILISCCIPSTDSSQNAATVDINNLQTMLEDLERQAAIGDAVPAVAVPIVTELPVPAVAVAIPNTDAPPANSSESEHIAFATAV